MNDSATKLQFVELRAKGKSFAKISNELGISKTTLIDWSRDLSEDILNLKAIETEALREQYQIGATHRIKMFSERLEAVRQELSTRDLSNIPTDKLYDLLFKLSDNLSKEDTQPAFVKTSVSFPSLDTETTDRWSA